MSRKISWSVSSLRKNNRISAYHRNRMKINLHHICMYVLHVYDICAVVARYWIRKILKTTCQNDKNPFLCVRVYVCDLYRKARWEFHLQFQMFDLTKLFKELSTVWNVYSGKSSFSLFFIVYNLMPCFWCLYPWRAFLPLPFFRFCNHSQKPKIITCTVKHQANFVKHSKFVDGIGSFSDTILCAMHTCHSASNRQEKVLNNLKNKSFSYLFCDRYIF